MADPISIASGIAGLISLGIQTTDALVKFYTTHKNRDSTIARLTGRLDDLLGTLNTLEKILQQRRFRPDEKDLLRQIESSIQQSDALIHELQEECEKIVGTPPTSVRNAIKVAGRRAIYPFRESTLKKLDEDISETRTNISFALNLLEFRDHQAIQDDIDDIKSVLRMVAATQIKSAFRDWFNAPDPAPHHNTACAKRHPGTGSWFVKGDIFTDWSTHANSFLWLNGFAGCGKSILCSTTIQYIYRRRRKGASVGIAFFYFTFSDELKRDQSGMLRALIIQLAGQLTNGDTILARLYEACESSLPPAPVLMACLRELIKSFNHVYILLDALDESPRYAQRDDVLSSIQTFRQWSLPGLHLLVTSRDEPDIRGLLCPSPDEEVVLKNREIDADIRSFVSGYLESDPQLRKWQKHRERIKQVLSERARGIFRWVECQFEALKRCPRSESHLNKCLQSLPRSLDETYERMLSSIDEGSAEEARKILTLLCFSVRPLTVMELRDAIVVGIAEPRGLQVESRLEDEESLQEICPGLINIADDDKNDSTEPRRIVRIAHFSVQEYLESPRIKQSQAANYALSSSSTHGEISQICCTYLLEPELSQGDVNDATLDGFPFARYAAQFWYQHHINATETQTQIQGLVLEIFKRPKGPFLTWVKLHDMDDPWKGMRLQQSLNAIPPPIYYASLLGLEHVLQELLNQRKDSEADVKALIECLGSECASALQAASYNGHDKSVQMLLAAGADVNAQSTRFRNSLFVATSNGHEKVVKTLLDAGADVHRGPRTALYEASSLGHESIVRLLLEAGADVNLRGGEYQTPICVASVKGHDPVVRLLLNWGAQANDQVGFHGGGPLQAASLAGNERVVRTLLQAGADVNAPGGFFGTAICVASTNGDVEIVRILLDAGAKVNVDVKNGLCSALRSAAARGHVEVVQMLLEAGAELTTDLQNYRTTALYDASSGGHKEIVEMLLKAGAEVDADVRIPRPPFTALSAAALNGRHEVVQQLLDAGAGVNACPPNSGNRSALHAASSEGHEKIVQLLIESGADLNAVDGDYLTPLDCASLRGHQNVVDVLRDAGMVTPQTIPTINHEDIFQALIDADSDVDDCTISPIGGGFSLHPAATRGRGRISELLLDVGGDLDDQM